MRKDVFHSRVFGSVEDVNAALRSNSEDRADDDDNNEADVEDNLEAAEKASAVPHNNNRKKFRVENCDGSVQCQPTDI